ncbi:MAG: TetR/AcrR family transcriptional regulator [Thermoanaerobaculia bacterium]
MRRPVGRPPGGKPEVMRRAILASAREIFSRAGFDGATTRAVAARAGVNIATLHYHFGTKAGLYDAVWEGTQQPLDEPLERSVTTPSPGTSGPTLASRTPSPGTSAVTWSPGTSAVPPSLAQVVGGLWDQGVAKPDLARLALFHQLVPPDSPASRPHRADPRAAPILAALAAGSAGGGLPPEQTAALVLGLLDAALLVCASRKSTRSGDATARSRVIGAALRLAGER